MMLWGREKKHLAEKLAEMKMDIVCFSKASHLSDRDWLVKVALLSKMSDVSESNMNDMENTGDVRHCKVTTVLRYAVSKTDYLDWGVFSF